MTYNVLKKPDVFYIGKQDEGKAETIDIDYSVWIERYGDGVITATFQGAEDAAPYDIVLTTANGVATWTVTKANTAAAGAGKLQLNYIVNDVEAKSLIWTVRVYPSMRASGEAPDGYQDWLTALQGLSAETQQNAQNAAQSVSDAEDYADQAKASADSITGLTVEAETLPAGSSATASFDADTDKLSLGIPRGGKGDTGATPDISIGTVETLNPDESATATITGTAEDPVLNLGIPKGDTGADGFSPSATVTKQDGNIVITVTDKDGTTSETLEVDDVLDETSVNPVQNAAIVEAMRSMLPVDTASGAIASFPDGADDVPMLSLKAQIEPVQEGSGDPSPDNVRPISGHTGVNVQKRGKNLLEPKFYGGIAYNPAVGDSVVLSTGIIDITDSVTKNGDVYEKSGASWNIPMSMILHISRQLWGKTVKFSGTVDTINGYRSGYYIADENNICIARSVSMNEQPTWTFTVPQGAAYIVWYMNSSLNGTMRVATPMIELGSTATDYEAFEGETIPVSWESEACTVYGGTVDVVSGVLTVTMAEIASYNGETIGEPWISDRDAYVAGTTPSIGAQVVYTLATPQTYQLTPEEVATYLGQNNIWNDVGDTEVTYRADIAKYIEKKVSG